MSDEGMTFQEMQDRAAELAELGAFSNTTRKPVWSSRVNDAYREFVWRTESRRGVVGTFTTVADQAEYTLTTPYWKLIQKVIYGTDEGQELTKTTEAELDILDPLWMVRDSSEPSFWLYVRPNVLRLHHKPDESSVTCTFRGIRAADPMTDPDEYPANVPGVYHEQICWRAYKLEAKRWARGDELTTLNNEEKEYFDWLLDLKKQVSAGTLIGARRRIPLPVADRVAV